MLKTSRMAFCLSGHLIWDNILCDAEFVVLSLGVLYVCLMYVYKSFMTQECSYCQDSCEKFSIFTTTVGIHIRCILYLHSVLSQLCTTKLQKRKENVQFFQVFVSLDGNQQVIGHQVGHKHKFAFHGRGNVRKQSHAPIHIDKLRGAVQFLYN